MPILHKELSYRIVGCAMEIHREIGPGLDEALYHVALYERLRRSGLPCKFKPTRRLIHKGIVADEFEADLIVANRVALELKCLDRGFAPAHYTQLICYLKCWQLDLGILFDFGKEQLVHKRVAYSSHPIVMNIEAAESPGPAENQDRVLLDRILAALRGIGMQYGGGYRDTTYRGIFHADLVVSGISVETRDILIECHGRRIGRIAAPCLVVGGRSAVMILALFERLHAAQRARLQTYLKHLRLPWGVLVNFGKKYLDWRYIAVPQRVRGPR